MHSSQKDYLVMNVLVVPLFLVILLLAAMKGDGTHEQNVALILLATVTGVLWYGSVLYMWWMPKQLWRGFFKD